MNTEKDDDKRREKREHIGIHRLSVYVYVCVTLSACRKERKMSTRREKRGKKDPKHFFAPVVYNVYREKKREKRKLVRLWFYGEQTFLLLLICAAAALTNQQVVEELLLRSVKECMDIKGDIYIWGEKVAAEEAAVYLATFTLLWVVSFYYIHFYFFPFALTHKRLHNAKEHSVKMGKKEDDKEGEKTVQAYVFHVGEKTEKGRRSNELEGLEGCYYNNNDCFYYY